jgi:vacuolar protein-sorting-associated protein 4
MEMAKQRLKEAVILPLRQPQLFKQTPDDSGLEPWSGLLLYGAPGTGKSYIASALAGESDCAFYSMTCADLISKWVGDSAKIIRELFEVAQKTSPSIIFIDEVETLLKKRGESANSSESVDQARNEMFLRWEGISRDPSKKVLVLAATNLPWSIDEAALRRFQCHIYVPLPDPASRRLLLKKFLGEALFSTLDHAQVQELVEASKDMSGSDVKTAINSAFAECMRRASEAVCWKVVKCNDSDEDYFIPCSPGDPDPTKFEASFDAIPAGRIPRLSPTFSDLRKCVRGARKTVSDSTIKKLEHYERTGEFLASAGAAC